MNPLRNPPRLRAQILLTSLALVGLGLGALIAWTGQRLQVAVYDRHRHDLERQAYLIAGGMLEPLEALAEARTADASRLQPLVASFAERIAGNVAIRDVPGRVVLAAGASGPEAAPAGADRLRAAAPIIDERGRTIATVELSVPMRPIRTETGRLWLSLLASGAVVLGAAAVAGAVLARRIAGPLDQLTGASESIAGGDVSRRVRPAGPEEVARLGVAFNRMAERVEEMLARQRSFAAHAAHELRTPLAGLRLRLDLLLSHGDDAALRSRYLAEMAEEVDGLRQLIEHLLTLTAIEEGDAAPRLPLDVAPLLYELADDLGPLLHQAGLALHVDVPPHLPPVAASTEQLQIVVRNLLDNALNHTPPGGRITLGAEAAGGTVHIVVSDTGRGIPADALPRIFDRFYRLEDPQARRRGTGLGLALVRAIVESHGGTVQVRSGPGEGSRFTVVLPEAA